MGNGKSQSRVKQALVKQVNREFRRTNISVLSQSRVKQALVKLVVYTTLPKPVKREHVKSQSRVKQALVKRNCI